MLTKTVCRAVVMGTLVLGLVGMQPLPTHAATTVQDCPTTESALSGDISSAGGGGTVVFTCARVTTISLTSAITISQSVTLDGGSSQPVILDGGGSTQLISVNAGVSFTVSSLTLQHGLAPSGGALSSNGTVTVSNSTLVDNAASVNGGAIFTDGPMTITNSTFFGNVAASKGGAIYNDARLRINNSTLSGNSATAGGAISNNHELVVRASIIANNTGGNCSMLPPGAGVVSEGYSITDNNGTCDLGTATDRPDTDPRLDPRGPQPNGGPTQTIALQFGSPAIDQIPPSSGYCPATDQRGGARPDASDEQSCDIGAYESSYAAPAITSISSTTFQVGVPGSFTIMTSGFPTPTLSLIGSLPSGVSVTDNPNGTATLAGTPAAATAGTYTLTVVAQNGIGSPVTQAFTLTVIAVAPTTTSLTSSASPSLLHQPVTLTATVAAAGGLPTGMVTFMDGSAVLATVPLDSSGTASVSISTLGVGTHTISAVYGGANHFLGSSASLAQQVTYRICPIVLPFDRVTTGHIKLKLQLCDVSGANLSSPMVTLSVVGISPSPGVPGSSGTFTFIPLLGGSHGGYEYSVDATHYKRGPYTLLFAVQGDPATHQVQFTVTDPGTGAGSRGWRSGQPDQGIPIRTS